MSTDIHPYLPAVVPVATAAFAWGHPGKMHVCRDVPQDLSSPFSGTAQAGNTPKR